MNDMEVLPPCFTYDPRISTIFIYICGDVLPKLLENERASREMQCRKTGVIDALADDLRRRARNELDDPGRNTGLCKDPIDQVIGVCSCGRWFPHHRVSDKSRCYCDVSSTVVANRTRAYPREDYHQWQ